MLERYLEELAASAGRELSPNETQALVAETRAHLEDSIQARLELGATPEEAEREAVTAFGAIRHIASETMPKKFWARCRWIEAYWGLYALVVLWSTFASTSMPEWVVGVCWIAFLVVAIGFGLTVFRSGRPDPLTVLRRSFFALVAGGALLLATHVVYQSDGFPQFVSRRQIESRIGEWEGMAQMAETNRVHDFSYPAGTNLPRVYRSWITELNDARARPLTNVVPAFRFAAMAVFWASGPALALDLTFGGLGALALRIRRRRRGGGLRA